MAQKKLDATKRYPDLDIFNMILLTKGPKGELGGFKPRFFIQNITERCMCCHGIPRSPYKASCGHSVCRSCLNGFVLSSQDPSCFECQFPMVKDECYPDLPLARQLNMLEIRCPYVSNCEWVGVVDQLKEHFSRCQGVSGLFRSWMLSIQTFLTNLQARSTFLDQRVDKLENTIMGHQEFCQQQYIEQDGRTKRLTEDLKLLRERCHVQHKNEKDRQTEDDLINKSSHIVLGVLANLAFDIKDENEPDLTSPNPSPPQNPIPAPRAHVSSPTADIWACTHCTYLNSSIYRICQSCYKTYEGNRPRHSQEEIARLCMDCGAQNQSTAVVCKGCHKQL